MLAVGVSYILWIKVYLEGWLSRSIYVIGVVLSTSFQVAYQSQKNHDEYFL